jgi:hypothetical protein
MTITDLLIISPIILGLGVLRFGVPLLLTWGIGRLSNKLEHMPV